MHSELRDGCLFLSGDITVQTVNAAVFGQFQSQCRQSGWDTLDLSGVNRADSSCLSLLLAAKRLHAGSLNIQGLPSAVCLLAELYEIESWISH